MSQLLHSFADTLKERDTCQYPAMERFEKYYGLDQIQYDSKELYSGECCANPSDKTSLRIEILTLKETISNLAKENYYLKSKNEEQQWEIIKLQNNEISLKQELKSMREQLEYVWYSREIGEERMQDYRTLMKRHFAY